MTGRDYVKFANMLLHTREVVSGRELSTVRYITDQIVEIFAHDNSNFDRERFYDACEPKKG